MYVSNDVIGAVRLPIHGNDSRKDTLRPPITRRATEPSAKYIEAVVTGLSFQSVATQAKTVTVVNKEMVLLPALKKLIAKSDMPTVNMWRSQTLKPTNPVGIVETATYGYPTIGRREKTGTIRDIIPVVGRKMM